MKNSKHTPGPWELSEGDTSLWARSPLNARVRIADVIKHSSMNGIDSAANAHLIAASPDMLEALEALIRLLERDEDTFIKDAYKLAYAAVAKAKGGAK